MGAGCCLPSWTWRPPSVRNGTRREYTRPMALSPVVWETRRLTEMPDTNDRHAQEGTGAAASRHHRPAAAPVQAAATPPRRSKSSWWCAITRSIPSPARWCSPAASSRRPTAIQRLRARCGGADKIVDDELKFRIAGVREAFEECGVLLARKRGQRGADRRRRPQGRSRSAGAPSSPRTRRASSTWSRPRISSSRPIS